MYHGLQSMYDKLNSSLIDLIDGFMFSNGTSDVNQARDAMLVKGSQNPWSIPIGVHALTLIMNGEVFLRLFFETSGLILMVAVTTTMFERVMNVCAKAWKKFRLENVRLQCSHSWAPPGIERSPAMYAPVEQRITKLQSLVEVLLQFYILDSFNQEH